MNPSNGAALTEAVRPEHRPFRMMTRTRNMPANLGYADPKLQRRRHLNAVSKASSKPLKRHFGVPINA
jgi:hypothetical protein